MCTAGGAGNVVLIPGSGRSPGGGNGNPLQSSCWENPVDKRACGLQSMDDKESDMIEHARKEIDCSMILT